MVSLDEELAVAQAAKTALDNVSPNMGATIRKAMDIAVHAVTSSPSGPGLDDARCIVVEALSNLLDAPEDALPEKVEEAKAAIEEWIDFLESD